uniref:Uncharacterized protein n=1 Tax=Lactuca sativa TaxID=4236 RepID=A0A9R1WKX4_LACSA|nr:hypothetical protein LSAT_V11C100003330 [Lactuca sativa]
MRVLVYGTSADAQDEYMRMSEIVTRDVVIKFVEGVISCFDEKYLRMPNEADLARLLHVGEKRGFLALIVCTRHGKIVSLLGLDNIQVEAVNKQSFWKSLRCMTYGYSMPSLEHQSITSLQLRKHKLFAKHQESARKMLNEHLEFYKLVLHFFKTYDMMEKIMIACIIIHNVIMED